MNDIPIEIRLRAAYLQGAMEALMEISTLGMKGANVNQIADLVTRKSHELKAESDGLIAMFNPPTEKAN